MQIEMLQVEEIESALCTAAETVLETMFFTMLDGDADLSAAENAELIRIGMKFSGARSGWFELRTSPSCAEAIAESFIGSEPGEELSPSSRIEVMCELANMVCGATLSHLDSGAVFNLASPSPLTVQSPGPDDPKAVHAIKAFLLGDGIIAFGLNVEVPS